MKDRREWAGSGNEVKAKNLRDEPMTEGRRDEKRTRRAVEGGGNGFSSRCSSFPCRSHPSFTSHVGSSCSTPPSVPSDVGNRHEEKVKDVRKTRERKRKSLVTAGKNWTMMVIIWKMNREPGAHITSPFHSLCPSRRVTSLSLRPDGGVRKGRRCKERYDWN